MSVRALPWLALALGLLGAPAAAEERWTALLTGLEPGRVQQCRFTVLAAADGSLVGTAAQSRGTLHTYGWLLDLDRLAVDWSMLDARPVDGDDGSSSFAASIHLEPGRYALMFFTGGPYKTPLDHLLGAAGQPVQGAFVALTLPAAAVAQTDLGLGQRAGAEAGPRPPLPGLDDATAPAELAAGVISLAPLGDEAFVTRRFRVARPTAVRIDALGELDARSRQLADRSWLVELASRSPVWEMTAAASEHVGGARKNRMERATLTLAAGSYELGALTDDSHSADRWNAQPPSAPDAWGVTLVAPPGALDASGVPAETVLVRLTGAGDDELLEAVLRLDAPTRVRVLCTGEWSSGMGRLADRGWIEDAASGARVWEMRYDDSRPGGGAGKNRVVDTAVELGAGTYRVRYRTDDSHSAASGWNSTPPGGRQAWGIVLSTFDPAPRWRRLAASVGAAPR